MKKRILVIDDVRTFREGTFSPDEVEVVYARNESEGYAILVFEGPWDEVWLDHDLGMDSLDVIEIAKDLEEAAHEDPPLLVDVKLFIVHSANPVGAKNIIACLDRFYNVKREEWPEGRGLIYPGD